MVDERTPAEIDGELKRARTAKVLAETDRLLKRFPRKATAVLTSIDALAAVLLAAFDKSLEPLPGKLANLDAGGCDKILNGWADELRNGLEAQFRERAG